jgi:hypothetical protein
MASREQQEAIQVGSIQKRDDIEIVASLARFRNDLYIDIREYVNSKTYQGPTRKGLRFHHESWEAFKELIEKIDKKLQEVG